MPSHLSIYVHKYSLQKIEGKIKNWTIQRHGHRGAQYVDRKQTKQEAQQRKLKPRTKWTPPKKGGWTHVFTKGTQFFFLMLLIE
jgi:hypothetical protein